jgi:predicted hotdog family 3-hydroxylacyl-ACP dehydratase
MQAGGVPGARRIDAMIPHRGRMLLVERLLQGDDRQAEVEAETRDSWPLATEAGVPPLVLVEALAQACGLLMAWRDRDEPMAGRGFLVGLRQARFAPGRVPLGVRLRLRVEILTEVDNYVVFHGRAEAAGHLWAEVELQTYRSDEMEAYRPPSQEATP